MYQVIGETVKSATSIKLGEIFGASTTRYKETITDPTYPNFFIYVVSTDIAPDNKNRWNLDYLVNIRYRYVRDVETITDLNEQLEAVGFRLLTEFTDITLETPIKVRNARYEKADGVLQFFFNVRVRVMRELTEEQKMRLLELNERLKEEDK